MAEMAENSEFGDLEIPPVEVFELRDSEDEDQILEPPLRPLVDLISESEVDDDEIGIIEPSPIPVVDVVIEDEDEIAPSMAQPAEHIVPMDIREDSEGELVLMEELNRVDLSWRRLES
jgi:hypothetical protein